MWGLYIRKSTKDAENEDTLDQQRRQVMRWATTHRYPYTEDTVYEETVSGAEILTKRPMMSKLLEDVSDGKLEGVIVRDQSRLARDQIAGLTILSVFQSAGIRLIYADTGQEVNLTSPEALLVGSFGFYRTSSERDDIRKRLSGGKTNNAIRGAWMHSTYPYGYGPKTVIEETGTRKVRRKSLEIIPEQAEVVERVYKARAEGKGYYEICTMLQDEGIPSPGDAGSGWSITTIKRMLESPVYKGYIVWGKTRIQEQKIYSKDGGTSLQKKQVVQAPEDIVYVKGLHDPIISEELWETVQGMTEAKPRCERSKQKNALAGLLRCAGCGYALVRQGARKGREARYTHKPDTRHLGCYRAFGASVRESVVIEALMAQLRADTEGIETTIETEAQAKKREDALKKLEVKLEKANIELDKTVDLLNDLLIQQKEDETDSLLARQIARAQERADTQGATVEHLEKSVQTLKEDIVKSEKEAEKIPTEVRVSMTEILSDLQDAEKRETYAEGLCMVLKTFISRLEWDFHENTLTVYYK